MAGYLREHFSLPQEGWSHWVRALIPFVPEGGQHHYEERNGNNGYICTNVKTAIPHHCGIYEWRAVKGDHEVVVYIGSTCRNRPSPSLKERILEYCNNGAHKKDLINDALERGYELHVRTKSAKSQQDAEDQENVLLKKYNYTWNIRNNHALRDILK